ncbi:MAG: serine hydrolase, partial [Ginsengibacter sp.]
YYFNADTFKYFYPASTVKLPVALLTLQKLNELKSTGITMNTTMLTDQAYSGQTAVYNDPNTPDGKPNIKQYIKKIFLVSDNDAYNRLYEFLGQHYINDELHKRGYSNAQILHRLDIFLSEDENRHTNPIKFLANDNRVLYQQPLAFNETKYETRNDFCGKAFYKGDSLIQTPMDFSKKNRLTLPDLHFILRSVFFPNSVAAKQRFNLSADDYSFIYKYMSSYPGESIYPAYDTANYPDAYIKFLMYGGKENNLPKSIRIFNKSGEAYGQLTDIAYVIDFDKKIEFFLSATINCTINGIINNDNYDYETVGYPFLKNLGKVIYDVEAYRKRSHIPDLSQFKIIYDK